MYRRNKKTVGDRGRRKGEEELNTGVTKNRSVETHQPSTNHGLATATVSTPHSGDSSGTFILHSYWSDS